VAGHVDEKVGQYADARQENETNQEDFVVLADAVPALAA